MPKDEPKTESEFDRVELLEGEIDTLMRRLVETDPDAIYRIEQLISRIRKEVILEFTLH